MSENTSECEARWPAHLNHQKFNDKVIELSEWGQKVPATTESFWLNDRTIVIKRTGVFVEIEKELIQAGYTNELKEVKKPLELRMIHRSSLESLIDGKITDRLFSGISQETKGIQCSSCSRKSNSLSGTRFQT
ncbi:hypothetical protein [uncultured Marinococcus sp.]|uniref:hypothetical protein n=1 Tax=uncultured Marinococcus sp. TaxID=487012 RepID=UPI00262AC853|nr:hypothetical protein [uncultured Marinococcus sp.]